MSCTCTKCSSDNVQRLEVLYEHGTQNINTSSDTVGVGIGSGFGGGGAKTTTSGTAQSKIAQKAAPPASKTYRAWIITIAIGALWFYLYANTSMFHAVNFIIFGVILVGIGGFGCYKAFSYNKNQYVELYEKWLKAWMCNKCGHIFILE